MIAVLPRRFKRLGIEACASVLKGFGRRVAASG